MISKCKICRRAGEKLFLKGDRCFSPKCAMLRKPYAPGGSSKKSRRLSDYGEHLMAKQKVRNYYGVSERQFKKYFMSVSQSASAGDLLLQKLETRLDNIVFRFGFANSRFQARQLVSHGHFLVNGKSVDIPSYNLKVGDVVSIRIKDAKKILFHDLKSRLKKYKTSDWLSLDLDKEKLEGRVVALPVKENIKSPFNMQLIVEYYSR